MIKGALIELIVGEIVKGSQTQDSLKQAHPRDIEYQISRAYSSILKTYFSDSRNLMGADLNAYAKKYTIAVSKDSVTPELRYVILPVSPIDLPGGMGIRSVRPLGGQFSFDRTTEDEIEVYRHLEAFQTGDAFFYKDGDRRISIIYVNDNLKIISSVVVSLIPQFEDYAMTDNIELPLGDSEVSKLILTTMGFRPTDNINDDAK